MRKSIVIAVRDYLAAVKTKSFLISLALMPIMVGVGIAVGELSKSVVDTSERKIAVIDRSAFDQARAATRPAGSLLGNAMRAAGAVDERPLYQVLTEAAQGRNAEFEREDGSYSRPPFVLESVALDDPTDAELERVRLELSERVREGELFAFIEIGPSIVATAPDELAEVARLAQAAEADLPEDDDGDESSNPFAASIPAEFAELQDRFGIRYSSKSTTNFDVPSWITGTLTPVVQARRLAGAGMPPDRVLQLIVPPTVNQRALAVEQDDGTVGYEAEPNVAAGILVPFFSVFLLFSLVATAAFPLTTNIIEEKQLRIAEVLLGSVRPFELMLGKLLGGVAISLTLASIYGVGLIVVALQFDWASFLSTSTVLWFLVFAALTTLMYGAMSVAAGAMVTNLKEVQNIQFPIVILPMAPAAAAINIVQNPHGPLAHALTWFPLTTPITAVMRITIRDGMPTHERVLAALLAAGTTVALIWLAGRVFRNGMLKSEKAAAFGDLVRWVTRG